MDHLLVLRSPESIPNHELIESHLTAEKTLKFKWQTF